LFRKIEDEEIELQRNKLAQTKINNQPMDEKHNPQKELVNFDDFTKMDLRVGTILSAEKMPKANKLLVLKVDVGVDQRTIVSGIAEHFTPEEIIGKQVCVLLNLAPRAIRGTESQGMILMAEDADGTLRFVAPEQAAAAGSSIR
jgi:methionyl-tRNA synthetase